MGLIKDVKYIKEKIEKITDETIQKAKAYDELKNLLKHIKFNVKNVSNIFDSDAMCYCVKVNYEIPSIKIHIDKDNNIERNEMFIAINTLDLISLSDMQKISKKIDELQKSNKE